MLVTAAARQIGVHHSTVSRLRSRYEAIGSLKDRCRTGRLRKTSAAEDRYIIMMSRWNCFMSVRKVTNQLRAATGTRVSAQTIRRRLYRGRLHARRPYVGVSLTRRHCQDRVNWARNHRCWTQHQWINILFTDKSHFTVDFADGRARVWRRSGERYHEQTSSKGTDMVVVVL